MKERNEAALVPQEEKDRQQGFMDEVASLGGGKYEIVTYGCQMNVRDSQTLAGLLEGMGYRPAARRENAALKKRARDGILVKLSYFPL